MAVVPKTLCRMYSAMQGIMHPLCILYACTYIAGDAIAILLVGGFSL